MATNFDKWKAALKPEDLVFKETDPLGDPKTYWAVWNLSGSECDSCPAQKVCARLHEEGLSKCCGYAFKTWANTEADEDKKETSEENHKETYRPKPIKVLRDPENKHRWKYECPRCRKFTAEKTEYNTIYCGECGHYASTYGWYEKIGFQEVPTDENTKWPDEPKFNYEKHMLPLKGVIEEMRKREEADE